MRRVDLVRAGFLQSLSMIVYIALVSVIFWKGNEWFTASNNYIGSLAFITLFSMSVLVSLLIVFAYPFMLVWEKKKTREGIMVIVYTACWLFAFFLLLLTVMRFW